MTEKVVEIEAGDRKRIVRNEFLRMVTATPSVRIAAKYPRELIPQPGEELLPIAPLSLLVNRCKARKSFAVLPGEKSTADNVMKTLKDLGIVTATLEDLGFARFSLVQVVLNRDTRSRFNPVKWKEDDELDSLLGDDDNEEPSPVPHKKVAKEPGPEDEEQDEELGEEDEDEPAPPPIRKKKNDDITFDWSSVGKEESFEESEAAQGVVTVPDRDKGLSDTTDTVDDEDVDIEDDENLSDTTDDVDDEEEEDDETDLGPDELEFDNPERQRFEKDAEEAYQREQERLASGEYYLLNGIVTKKKK